MKTQRDVRKDCKCDCGHIKDKHFGGGQCEKCGCTWFHPSIAAVNRTRKRLGMKPLKF